jgi:flagellar hook-associated protein 2
MPISLGGVASGMDTNSIIEKLVQVESKPIVQLEQRKKEHARKKDALEKLSRFLRDLSSASEALFGFRANFDAKKALSSDPAIVDVKANNNAEKGLRHVKVLQIATSHKISTDPIGSDDTLPEGDFTLEVNGEKHPVRWKGGRLKDLVERIEESASENISVTYINTSGDKHIMTLESKTQGKRGEIKISGDVNFLSRLGMVKGTKEYSSRDVLLTFDQRYFGSYEGAEKHKQQNGTLVVSKDGKAVSLKGLLWQEYVLPVDVKVREGSRLEFDLVYKEPPKEESDEQIPYRLEDGPDEKINIKGIELEGYNISRMREGKKQRDKTFDTVMGIGIVSIDGGKRNEKLYLIDKGSKGKQELPIGKDFAKKQISRVVFYCNIGTADFSNAKIITPLKEKGHLNPKNNIAKPDDARIKIDGIEMTRPKNEDLTDVIKGLSLDLKRPSELDVTITVNDNIEDGVDKIKKFVEAYNKYMDFHRELVKAPRIEKPGENTGSDGGPLMGDTTVSRLESNLRMTINGAYMSHADKPIRLITQMGLSTGAINASWESIKSGKLIIDEQELKKTVQENPEGVKFFFGSDNDGDNRIDGGMAYKLVAVLKPYISSGKNIIASKIDFEDSSIKMADDSIKRHGEHLKKYEEMLKQKFRRMEQAISQSNGQKRWMNQQFGGGDKGDK